jgi:hypothetical protein
MQGYGQKFFMGFFFLFFFYQIGPQKGMVRGMASLHNAISLSQGITSLTSPLTWLHEHIYIWLAVAALQDGLGIYALYLFKMKL